MDDRPSGASSVALVTGVPPATLLRIRKTCWLTISGVRSTAAIRDATTASATTLPTPPAGSWILAAGTPAPKKRRSAAAIAPSSSGTTCPPLCHSVVIFSQRDGTLLSCAALSSSSALPSTCSEGTITSWGTSRSMLVGRRSHGVLQKLMRNWSDGERAATAAAMSAPSEMPQMPLIGACCSIQRSTCRTLSQAAAARPASSAAADPQPKYSWRGCTLPLQRGLRTAQALGSRHVARRGTLPQN
eukprot:scaffold47137_cov64-Phaeocystis_antarctica.AAC.4